MKAGGPIRIRYFAGDPAINHPADWEPSAETGWTGLALPGVMVLLAGGILFALRRQRGLVSEGSAAPAVITGVSWMKSGWNAEYEFRPAQGVALKGTLSLGAKPEIGSTVTILYDPAKPSRKTQYPSAWYRAGE